MKHRNHPKRRLLTIMMGILFFPLWASLACVVLPVCGLMGVFEKMREDDGSDHGREQVFSLVPGQFGAAK